MHIQLHDFPDLKQRPLHPGNTITGRVSFTIAAAEKYTSLGCEFVLIHSRNGHQETEVISTHQLATNIEPDGGQELSFRIKLTIPEGLNYKGELFSVRPAVRGYARPVRKRSAALRQPANFYPTSEPLLYSLVHPPFRAEGELKMRFILDTTIYSCLPVVLVFASLIVGSWFFGLGWKLGGLVIGGVLLAAAGYVFVAGLDERTEIIPPEVRLETTRGNLIARVKFRNPPKGIWKVSAGYEVREQCVFRSDGEDEIVDHPSSFVEPRQKITLDENGFALAEHQYVAGPGPGMRNGVGFLWVYVVKAKIGDKDFIWEGEMV